jgi:hypothetical protein
MKTTINFILVLFIICVTSGNISAQAPEGIKYQAVARDGNGQAIENSNIGIEIAILQGSYSGTVVYKEDHTTLSNDFGMINITIGMGNVITGSFTTIDWSDGPYFVEVSE